MQFLSVEYWFLYYYCSISSLSYVYDIYILIWDSPVKLSNVDHFKHVASGTTANGKGDPRSWRVKLGLYYRRIRNVSCRAIKSFYLASCVHSISTGYLFFTQNAAKTLGISYKIALITSLSHLMISMGLQFRTWVWKYLKLKLIRIL